MKTPVIPDLRDQKFKILKKAVKKFEKDGIKESLARNGITQLKSCHNAKNPHIIHILQIKAFLLR